MIWQDIKRECSPFQPLSLGSVGIASSLPSLQPHPYLLQMHLLSYGASYYCYLYCRVFASLVWRLHFAADPMSASAGASLRRDLFAPGGAVPPADILRTLAHVPQGSTLQHFVQQQLPIFLNAPRSSSSDNSSSSNNRISQVAQQGSRCNMEAPVQTRDQRASKGAGA